jgi:ABC-type antimicrobial peptide transport system permease subunit
VRMAMGATPRGVMTSVLRDALQTGITGVAFGLALAIVAGRSLRTMLYDVSPLDPGVFVLASVLLVGVAVVASYLPARRASTVNPVTALRGQ